MKAVGTQIKVFVLNKPFGFKSQQRVRDKVEP